MKKWLECIVNTLLTTYRFFKALLILMGMVGVGAWLVLNLQYNIYPDNESVINIMNWFGDIYGIMALTAGGLGFLTAQNWGLFQSKVGKSIWFISLGLSLQFLGQLTALYYTRILGVELPYPSWAELFYFGSIPVYITGVLYLMQACAINISTFKKSFNILSIIVLILGFMFLDYTLFLSDYQIGEYTWIAVFLDYSYPILQSVQVALVIFTFWFSLKALGGKLKWAVLFLIIGLYAQYLGDTLYTYFIYQEKWRQGDITDLLYLLSYFLIGISFLKFKSVYIELTSRKNVTKD